VKIGEEIIISLPPEHQPEYNDIDLQFDEIRFSQEGVQSILRDGKLYIDGSKQLTIHIPYERLPEHLKTILVTIYQSESKSASFSFILRVNPDKTGYTATIAPFGISGVFPIDISVFDFKTMQIGYTNGTIVSEVAYFFIPRDESATLLGRISIGGVLLSLLLLAYYFYRHIKVVRRYSTA